MVAVSVLMPCFNAADTIEESLATIAAQTHPDFEVILVDDGSQDETPQILKRWQASDPRFRAISIAHGGIINALNAGLAACEGGYVARMDADDRSMPSRLEKQAGYLDAHPETALVSCLVRGFPENEVREGFRIYIDWLNSLATHDEMQKQLFVESPVAHPSVMFRRDVVQGLDGYHEHGWAEDYDLWLRMSLAGCEFAKIRETLLEWREHPERLTRTDSRYSLENFLRAKAHYLMQGPLSGGQPLVIWGAGMMGKRLSKYLLREGANIIAFIDVDEKKIGGTRRKRPIVSPDDLPALLEEDAKPVVLAAVGARGARQLIRDRLEHMKLAEGRDWWAVA
jgi:glycosyltransferase involved in cell wall biosynthesis